MNNIIVFAHLFKPHLGGLEKYVENFYTHIPNKKTIIITSLFDKSLKQEDEINNVSIFRIDCYQIIKDKYYIPTIKGYKQIKEIIEENKKANPEIHTHTRFYLNNYIATRLAKKNKLTHYHFEHGASFVQDGSIIVRLFAYLFDMTLGRYILRNSDLIFPISESVKEFLETHYKNIKFGPTLYNSYDFGNKSYIKKEKPEVPKLLFVGRLVKSKGIYELLEAAKILKEENFPFTLDIIGDGSEMEKVKEYISEHDLEKEIKPLGKLPYEETQKQFPKHDIFINPSYTEGLPTTVLEAVAHSLLVVATNAGGTKEILPKQKLIDLSEINGKTIANETVNTYENWEEKEKILSEEFSVASKKFNLNNIVEIYDNIS